LFCNIRIREAALSSKRDGQGDKEGPKATEDISDEDEKEENWEEEMEKVSTDIQFM
jgi:hypothetical protein